MVASITTWFRLEPLDQSSDLEASLTAPIADPLWLLHRQWQIGELHANDAGSPIAVTVDYQQTRLSRFRAGPANGGTEAGTVVDYDPQQLPLEVVVEAEPTRGLPDQHRRLAAEAGLAFLRLLPGGLGQLHQAYRDLFPLRAERSPRPEADPIGAEAAILLNRRAIDGDRLADRLRRFRDSHGGKLTSLPADFPQGSHPADVLAARHVAGVVRRPDRRTAQRHAACHIDSTCVAASPLRVPVRDRLPTGRGKRDVRCHRLRRRLPRLAGSLRER